MVEPAKPRVRPPRLAPRPKPKPERRPRKTAGPEAEASADAGLPEDAPSAPAAPPPGADLLPELTPAALAAGRAAFRAWFAVNGYQAFEFQEECWRLHGEGRSGLVHVPTGSGKTYAAFGGPFAALWAEAMGEALPPAEIAAVPPEAPARRPKGAPDPGLRVVYLTPLRAVANDIEAAIRRPMAALLPGLRVESRTGDTSATTRSRQSKRLPAVLVTTPESLSLLLARGNALSDLAGVHSVVVDEWHALLGSKRGTQTELALAALRRCSPALRVWALSATLPNVGEAAAAAVGPRRKAALVTANLPRPIEVDCLIPDAVEAFPWSGHLGLQMVDKVVERLDPARSTLIFTNTRNQAEHWFQALSRARPDWAPVLGLHHSAVDKAERVRVESGLADGTVTLVVCTTSLDLGVDFGPVDRVFNIGSPKGIARLIQRAGRSGHRPGAASCVVCVPTHALELVEIRAARAAIEVGDVEPRRPLEAPLDVLAQHLVTRALGGGFRPDDLFEEVRDTAAYAELSRAEFDWALSLVRHGGATLGAYPEYHKVVLADDGERMVVTDERVARVHRLSIGTITDDAQVAVRFANGSHLGVVEETFAARLNPRDRFVFAGRVLEFVRLRDLVCLVKPSRGRPSVVPRWGGAKMPVSTELARAMLRTFAGEVTGGPELVAAAPVLDVQRQLSRLPGTGTVLAETVQSREGYHLFLYPFAGRNVHEGLAALLCLRLARVRSTTFSTAVNDYGLELLCAEPVDYAAALAAPDVLFDDAALLDDVLAAINLGELARRQFREVARVAGLVFGGFPGKGKTLKQVQTSSGLLFDVFSRYDPENLLVHQARREVLVRSFELSRFQAVLRHLRAVGVEVRAVSQPTPLAFPLMMSRINQNTFSNEDLATRVARLKASWAVQ